MPAGLLGNPFGSDQVIEIWSERVFLRVTCEARPNDECWEVYVDRKSTYPVRSEDREEETICRKHDCRCLPSGYSRTVPLERCSAGICHLYCALLTAGTVRADARRSDSPAGWEWKTAEAAIFLFLF